MILICLLLCLQFIFCARFNIVDHQDQPVQIQLKSQYDIEPGSYLKLNIDVEEEYLSLYGALSFNNSDLNNSILSNTSIPNSTVTSSNTSTSPPSKIDAVSMLNISVNSSKNVFTAGDNIDLLVKFNGPVTVVGHPIIWIRSNPSNLNARIRNAPAFPAFSFRQAIPDHVCQTKLSFSFSWELAIGDVINLYLPQFRIHSSQNSLLRPLILSGVSANSFTGIWNTTSSSLTLRCTLNTNNVSLIVSGSSGIYSPKDGVLPSNAQIYYSIISSKVAPELTKQLNFLSLGPIGFNKISLLIDPKSFVSRYSIVFKFEVTESIILGDSITLIFRDFHCDLSSAHSITLDGMFSYMWNYEHVGFKSFGNLTFSALKTLSILEYTFNISTLISLQIPYYGVIDDSVVLNSNMQYNGVLSNYKIPFSTNICGFSFLTVEYLNKCPNCISSIQLSWSIPFDLHIDDMIYIYISVPELGKLDSSYCDGSSCKLFNIFSDTNMLSFQMVDQIQSNSLVSITLNENLEAIVPSEGIIANYSSFAAKITSSACFMSSKKVFDYSYSILKLNRASIRLLNSTTMNILSANVALEIDFHLTSMNTFKAGDVIELYVKNIEVRSHLIENPFFTIISSGLNLSCHYDYFAKIIYMKVLHDEIISLTSRNITISIPSSVGFITPNSSIGYNDFILTILSASLGSLYNQSLSTICYGFCYLDFTFSNYFYDSLTDFNLNTSFSQDILADSHIIIDLGSFLTVNQTIEILIQYNNSFNYLSEVTSQYGNLIIPIQVNISALSTFSIKVFGLILPFATQYQPMTLYAHSYHRILESDIRFYHGDSYHRIVFSSDIEDNINLYIYNTMLIIPQNYTLLLSLPMLNNGKVVDVLVVDQSNKSLASYLINSSILIMMPPLYESQNLSVKILGISVSLYI